ncbi:MAG: DUF86 domain-containing protein [Caldilineales bacterium]|nr:DUF86 domain-containing protein [Caldilineales bacterium]
MRPERLYLTDMLEAADAIHRFLLDVPDKETFYGDELRQSAILQKLIVIGEAATRLSDDFKIGHPEVEWAEIVAFRNIAVHAYFSIAWEIVWVTATDDVPRLRRQIAGLIRQEK